MAMGKLLQQIVSAWLATALLLAPLPVLSLDKASTGNDHCLSQGTDGHAQHHQADTAAATPDCPHCTHDGCGDGGCNVQDCSSFNSSTTCVMMVISQPVSPRSDHYSPFTPVDLYSRAAPPLLRPPL